MTNNTGHEFYKKFSFPINIQEIFVNKLINAAWFKRYSEIINEIYISSDFLDLNFNDMNGDVKNNEYPNEKIIEFLKDVQSSGIKICVIFNDIKLDNNDMIKAFDKLKIHESLVDIIVVPNKEWLNYSKEHFNFIVKNTVVSLPTYVEIKNGEYDEYDIIYIHDEIIHNFDKYYEIKGDRKFGTVVNFGDCTTFCEHKAQHYGMLRHRKYNDVYFCPTNHMPRLELLMTRCSIPGYLSEFRYYNNILDIFKLQGRQTTNNFKTAIKLIERIYNYESILDVDYTLVTGKLKKLNELKWRVKVRNCGGDCPNCSFCYDLYKDHTDDLFKHL